MKPALAAGDSVSRAFVSRPVILRVAALLVFYQLLDGVLRSWSRLPEESYRRPLIVLELATRVIGAGWVGEMLESLGSIRGLVLVVCVGGLLAVASVRYPRFWRNYRALWHPWTALSDGGALRAVVGLIVFLATWLVATHDYNLFYDQGHALDRLILIALAALTYYRPVFVLPLVVMLLGVFHQFSYPLGNNPSWTELDLFLRALLLFVAVFTAYVVTGKRGAPTYFLLLCCLIASCYWGSGLGKLRLNWISHPHLDLLPLEAYANGWLAFLDPATIVSISQRVSVVTLPLMLFTLAVEWGAPLLLWRRSFTIAWLGGCIAFHLGIFAFTGMFFWKWMILEGALIGYFLRQRGARFTRTHFVLSLILICGSPFWFKPVNLSWYDTRLTYVYRFAGEGESGTLYRLGPHDFTPYRDLFTLRPFSFLSPYPQLTGLWGITDDRDLAEKLVSLSTAEEVFALERDVGESAYDPGRTQVFEQFIRRFVGAHNARRSKAFWLSGLKPPPHLWSHSEGDGFPVHESITKVVVDHQVTVLYSGRDLVDIRERRIREIEIPIPVAGGL